MIIWKEHDLIQQHSWLVVLAKNINAKCIPYTFHLKLDCGFQNSIKKQAFACQLMPARVHNCINVIQPLHVPFFTYSPRLSRSLLERDRISWFLLWVTKFPEYEGRCLEYIISQCLVFLWRKLILGYLTHESEEVGISAYPCLKSLTWHVHKMGPCTLV